MATVYPFRALRPRPDLADQVASVPYDVVNRAEARALADGNQKSFLHVTKPEIDLSDEVGLYDDAVYAQAKTSLDRLVAEGTLVRDDKACFYAYELVMDGRAQTGVVLAASVPEYDDNIVRKHEYTRPDKENDRVRNVETLQAQSGTVFLIHKDHDEVARVIAEAKAKEPAYGFTTPDGIGHRFWVIDNDADIKTIEDGFTSLGPIYIADGHHRSAAASRVAAANRKGDVDPNNTYEKFLAVSFPQNELKILPYNRVVKDLLGKTPAEFLAAVKEVFDVSEGKPATTQTHQYAMYLDKKWYALTARDGSFDANDPVERLDVSILQ
ncbi:DUF1015 domain-containing protein, partial [Myxococcota bacterium]|nr:DUF1015 domain-containing protein [Myxococcota bacterium]